MEAKGKPIPLAALFNLKVKPIRWNESGLYGRHELFTDRFVPVFRAGRR